MMIRLSVVLGVAMAFLLSAARSARGDVLAEWTFEGLTGLVVSGSANAGPYASQSGVVGGIAVGQHASALTNWSAPAGNGSTTAWNANTWAVGTDFYEFTTATAGYGSIVVSWDMARSGTGPTAVELQASVNGGAYATIGTYTVLLNGAPNGSWSSIGARNAVYTSTFTDTGMGPVVLADRATLALRIVCSGAPTGTGGTMRVDNVRIEGTLLPPPCTPAEITAQPAPSAVVCDGSPAVFTVGVSGTPAPSVQWRKNGVNIDGATGLSYTIPVTAAQDAGSYDCVVSNGCGTPPPPSDASVLTVDAIGPAITQQPADLIWCFVSGGVTSGPFQFSLTATGTGLHYFWEVSLPGDSSPWSDAGFPDSPNIDYGVGGIVVGSPGVINRYRCTVTDSCGRSVVSAIALFRFVAAPGITTHPPATTSACLGYPATFTIVAPEATGFEWRKNGTPIDGATLATYTIPAVVAGDVGSYDCIASGICGSSTSTASTLSLDPSALPTITQQPQNLDWCWQSGTAVGTVYFSVAAVGNGLTYNWQIADPGPTDPWVDMGSQTSTVGPSAGYVNSPAPFVFKRIRCVITDACGRTITTNEALWTMAGPPVATIPATVDACVGLPASMTATPTGVLGTVSYQWHRGLVQIPGATAATYTIPSVALGDAGSYTCTVTNVCGSANFEYVELIVGPAPSITMQPLSLLRCVGAAANFVVAATPGTGGPTYQWFERPLGSADPFAPIVNGANAPPGQTPFTAAGATAANLSLTIGPGLTNIAAGGKREVRAVATYACGAVTSSTVVWTVCPADFNCSGALEVADIFAFLNAWFSGDPNADFNEVPGLQVADIFAFLNAWFAGC